MSLEGRKLYKVLLACLCFFLGSIFILILLLNELAVNPIRILLPTHKEEVVKLVINIVIIILFLWGGIRLMKRPQKKQQPVELFGEEF